MKTLRWSLQGFLCLVMLAFGMTVYAEGTSTTTEATPTAQAIPQTNEEIRQWYNDQVAVIPALNDQWLKEGLSAEERARKAYEIRHHARIQAREYMPNKQEVADLQARDQEKYGNPDGPTFDHLVQKNADKGLQGDAVYEDIVGSSNRTNAEYNARFNVTPQTQTQTPTQTNTQ